MASAMVDDLNVSWAYAEFVAIFILVAIVNIGLVADLFFALSA
jgi:hypothetical protein